MASRVTITVDDDEVRAMLTRAERSLDDVVEDVAHELSDELRREGGQRSERLARPWPVKGLGPSERRVEAPEWWAHFLAGGTQAHGPRVQTRMVFQVEGAWVFARRVEGIRPDPFDERAIRSTEGRVDDIIRRAIGGLL